MINLTADQVNHVLAENPSMGAGIRAIIDRDIARMKQESRTTFPFPRD